MSRVKKTIISMLFIFVLLSAIDHGLSVSYAESEIAGAEKLFLEGRYDKVITECGRLIDARSRQRDEVYYLKGLSELKTCKYGDAKRSFEDLIAKYPRSKRLADAYTGIGDSYFLEGRYDDAAKSYKDTIQKFPKDKNVCVLNDRLAECGKKSASSDDGKDEVCDNGKGDSATNFTPKSSFVPQEVPRGEESAAISVQVGSFKNKRNAQHMSQKLHRLGYESYVEIPVGSGDRLYRVKVGRLSSVKDAEELAARLKKSGYKSKVCGK